MWKSTHFCRVARGLDYLSLSNFTGGSTRYKNGCLSHAWGYLGNRSLPLHTSVLRFLPLWEKSQDLSHNDVFSQIKDSHSEHFPGQCLGISMCKKLDCSPRSHQQWTDWPGLSSGSHLDEFCKPRLHWLHSLLSKVMGWWGEPPPSSPSQEFGTRIGRDSGSLLCLEL